MSELEGQVGFLLPLVKQLHADVLRFEEKTTEDSLVWKERLTVLKERSTVLKEGLIV